MGFDLMDVFVKIGADTSELESGVDKTKGLVGGIGSAVGSGLKVVGAAVGAATAAVGAFGASSVEVGKTFDSSMSQVAATMGFTVDQLNASETELANMTEAERTAAQEAQSSFGQLRDYAQQMGATTAFSATQAADALNYMALAGYDTQQSMSMLPNVLNLAAAGDMELARASDMVTDAATALGFTLEDGSADIERTTELVDMMAKASSKSNTSVSGLGDAILTIGGTAKNMAGGTLELTTALGVLADNGIKGSEAGTHLRNAILSLSAPTDNAAAMLESLGIKTKDAEGNLLPIQAIMGQLGASLDGLGTAERAEVISTIFNKTDIAAVNALLDTTDDRWIELGEAIDDSKGAAEAMANTQLDNLAGDITLFKSALEGAQILVSDALTPSLREFVQFGTQGLTRVSDAFKADGLTGAMEAFGDVLSDGLNMVIEKLPEFLDAGMQLLGALGQGIMDNLPMILDAAQQILMQLATGILTALPSLVDGALQILMALGQFLIENGPTLIPMIVNVVMQIVQMLADNAPLLVTGAIELLTGLALALVENIPTLIPAIIELVTQVGLALLENLPILLQAVIDINIALVQAIIENMPVIIEAVLQVLVAVLNMLLQYGAQFVQFVVTNGAQILQNLVTWLSQVPVKLAYYAGYAIGEFMRFFLELPGKLQQIWTNVINAIVNFGNNMKNKAIAAAKGFTTSLINGVKDLPNRFREIGSNIVNGIWNGISSGWNWLTSKVSELANSLLQGVKDALGISSPSKEFAWVGKMVDEGFAKGIDKYDYLVNDAIEDLTTIPDVNVKAGLEAKGSGSVSNNVVINVYGAVGQDVEELAQIISKKIDDATGRRLVAMGAGT